jgi:undecaprenyl-phosphate 4-deoxy-4-formamido-L-arabinose transferase
MPLVEYSVVIPVYRSAETLRALLERLSTVLDDLGSPYEIVLVDDGSPDDSWHILCELRRLYPDRVVAVQLMRNYGQHNALMCGFRRSRGRFIVTMDDDLQNPPEEVPKLLEALRARDLDLVYGSYGSKAHSGWRNLGSRLVNAFFRMVFRSGVTVTSFRAIRRELLESIFSYNLNFTFIDGLLAWNTQRIGEVAVDHQPRAKGRSGYSLSKLAVLALNLFTNFSLLPLQVVSLCGLVVSVAGLLTALYYLVEFVLHQITVPGYASTIIAVLVLGGLQLLSLGIMGEYLGRLHLNVNRKPQYTERQILTPVETVEASRGASGNGAP